MKISEHKADGGTAENVRNTPKFRNIHEEKEIIPDEVQEGADKRLILAAAIIGIFILIIGIKGSIAKSSLSSQLEDQNRLLAEAQAEALLYGITQDEDGDLVIPVDENKPVDVAELEWDSIEQRNNELLSAFTKLLLNWEGRTGYNNVRQKLIADWKFTEDSRLLSAFMPEMDEETDANMSLSGYSTFVLENDGKNMSYFLICTVRNTINSTSATGTVGIRIMINEDGTVSNVTAQTLS